MKEAGYIILFMYFLVVSIYDIRKKEIPVWISVMTGILLFVRQIVFVCRGEVPIQMVFWGVSIGIMLLIVSVLTRGEIGAGDGMMFIVSGFVFGFYDNGVLLFISLAVTAAVSVVLLAVKHVGKKYTLPFAPFVFVGYGVMCLWKLWE